MSEEFSAAMASAVASLRTIVAGGIVLGALSTSTLADAGFAPTSWPSAQQAAVPLDVPQVDAASVYDSQPVLLERQAAALAPQRPGITDLYFVGFAGNGSQDVFMKEVRAAQSLFDERFDTQQRSISLVNNADTVGELPLANAANLRSVLGDVADVMDRDEDVLFLFLSSHGSRDHRLSVDFFPAQIGSIGPGTVGKILDESGIKWRVVVVSACYSGAFVDALKNDHTMIITAAAGDRSSFGCSNSRDFTWFGKAFFDDQLRSSFSFDGAFAKAKRTIAAWETLENLKPSEPQIHVGAAIEPVLDGLTARLRQQGDAPEAIAMQ
ncbi:MAG: C13 family peptidase [Dongiaceae bacterium]